MVKAVIFDLGQVIIAFDLQRGYTALASRCPLPPEEIPKRIAATDLVSRFEMGRVSPQDFVQQFCGLLELQVSYAEFCELWSSIFLPHTLIPESLLAGLRRNYRLLLLSNTNAIHFAMIRERYPLLRHFHERVLSYEIGVLKPDPEIYRQAIARAGCRPQECFYTDDTPLYVEAARQLGMDAVQFHSLRRLETELRVRAVSWQEN